VQSQKHATTKQDGSAEGEQDSFSMQREHLPDVRRIGQNSGLLLYYMTILEKKNAGGCYATG
jgi:hypothetical protein